MIDCTQIADKQNIQYTYMYLYGVGSSAARVQSKMFFAPRGETAVSTAVRGRSGGGEHACPGLFQRPRNSISRWTCKVLSS